MRAAPAVSRAICTKESAHEHTGSAENIRPSLRNGFTAYFVLSLVSRALLPPSFVRAWLSRTWRQRRAPGPHDFAVRISAVRQRHIRVHRIPPHVRDDREPPLLSGETRGEKPLICSTSKAKYFCALVWTGQITLESFDKILLW
jgi:hypothetical protein